MIATDGVAVREFIRSNNASEFAKWPVGSENSIRGICPRNQNMIAGCSLLPFFFVRVLCDCFKSRRRLEAEILVLRHQLNVLQQRHVGYI